MSTVIWEKKYAPKADSKYLSVSHDFVLVYSKSIDRVTVNRLQKTEKQTKRYMNRDNDPRGPWKAGDTLRNEVRDYAVFPVKLPSGREVWPSAGTSWRYTREKFAELIADNRIWFGVTGSSVMSTTPRCWPRRSASWKALPTRLRIQCTGSTATRPNGISSMSPHKA